MIIGVVLVKTNFIDELRNIKTVGWMTLIFGLLLFYSDKFKLKKNVKNDFNFKTALMIGFFQVLALIPGVSRSGITITAARLLNFKRYDAAKLSFLLSIPTLAAVSIFGIDKIIRADDLHFSMLNLISIFLSFLFSLLTIKFFLSYIQKFSMNIFVIYRVILGLFLLTAAYL